MIIVSQDRCNFVNFDNVINIGLEERSTLTDVIQITAETSGHAVILGKYEEERAKEVLNEINIAYSDFQYFKYVEEKSKQSIGIKIYQRYGNLDVYEMPKE